MKIQSNIVWDKHTGELIGYFDLGVTELNYATLEKTDNIAIHILAFLIRSIVNSFKFSLANFATSGALVSQMFHLLRVSCSGSTPQLTFFFKSTPPKLIPPPLLKNEIPPPEKQPPIKHEKPFHEMIPRKSTININLKSS